MSTLRMSCPYVGTLDLRVLSFNSTLQGTFSTSQTKHMRHHWPVKGSQQGFVMQVQFNGWPELNALQEFVRSHHKRSLLTVQYPEVTMYWPARNIINWTGLIKDLDAGDERFNYAPRAQLNIILVDSLLSSKTFSASMSESITKWHETDIGNPDPRNPLRPPRPPNTVITPGR